MSFSLFCRYCRYLFSLHSIPYEGGDFLDFLFVYPWKLEIINLKGEHKFEEEKNANLIVLQI